MKNIALLGATGSIGDSTLQVVRDQPNHFKVKALAARSSVKKILQQAEEFDVKHLCLTDSEANEELRRQCQGSNRVVHRELKELIDLKLDMVIGAVVGAAGMEANLLTVERGIALALANKETLVMAGDLVMSAARKSKAQIFPVDSEHSAIWQCLWRQEDQEIETIILTASGGPFFGRTKKDLETVSCDQALNHPTWKMGPKITIDSATLMNKGLEVIEARHLFQIPIDKIEVLVHRQSIIHSMVTFCDGSVMAQMGLPDMKLPIQIAMSYPKRLRNPYPRLDLASQKDLTFEKPDLETFRCLALAFEAAKKGGTSEAVLNAANEVAVERFLKKEIKFLEIAEIIEKALENHPFDSNPDLTTLKEVDAWARRFVRERSLSARI